MCSPKPLFISSGFLEALCCTLLSICKHLYICTDSSPAGFSCRLSNDGWESSSSKLPAWLHWCLSRQSYQFWHAGCLNNTETRVAIHIQQTVTELVHVREFQPMESNWRKLLGVEASGGRSWNCLWQVACFPREIFSGHILMGCSNCAMGLTPVPELTADSLLLDCPGFNTLLFPTHCILGYHNI